jgi:hypothetical protein
MMHWVLGEFAEPRALLGAVRTLRGEHVRVLDTHTPYRVHGLDDALGLPRSPVRWWALAGALLGAAAGWALQLSFVERLPLEGNKPPLSVPLFLPFTLEVMALGAGLAIAAALLLRLWDLPRPYHPAFEHEAFVSSASSSGFWLSVSTGVPEDAERARGRLEALGAKNVAVIVEPEGR